jgi:hypothetical protein
MEDPETDEAETVAAAAFNAQQEIDDLDNSTIISEDRNGMSSDPYCTIGEEKIHKARYLNMLLSADGKSFRANSKKSFDRLKRVAGEAKFNVAKESSVQRAAELAADHVREWTEDIQTMDSDGEEDDFWCKDDPVAFLCRGVETSKRTTTCLVVGRMKGFGRNGNALCEHRMPANNISGWFIDVSVEVVETQQDDPTKIKTTGNVAFEIPKMKATYITPLNPVVEVLAPGIHVNVLDLGTLEELKDMLLQKGSVVELPKQTSLSPYYPLQSAGSNSLLVAHSESADDSRLASSLECQLCHPPRRISFLTQFERGYRNHVARHIMEEFPGMSSEPCGQCGDPGCIVSVSGNQVSVECRLKFQPFKMSSCNKVTQLYPSTNHPVECTICDKCVWTYSLVRHYNAAHNLTVVPRTLQHHLPSTTPDADPSKNESMLLVKKYKINKDGHLI